MKTSDFDYELPEDLIAQTPVEPRDHSRLMVVRRATGEREDKHFYDIIDYLNPNDALVINETKVIPARLLGEKEDTGVPVEVLLLRRKNQTDWEALVRPGRRLKPGTTCVFGGGLLKCEILESVPEIGGRIVRFHYEGVFEELLALLGRLDAFGGAAVYRDVHVFLELADGFAQVRLSHEEIFRGPRNGARLRHLDCVAQMLDIVHKFILRSLFRHAPIIAEKVKKCAVYYCRSGGDARGGVRNFTDYSGKGFLLCVDGTDLCNCGGGVRYLHENPK